MTLQFSGGQRSAVGVLFPVLDTWLFTIIVSNVRNVFARWEPIYEISVGHDHSKSRGAEHGKQYTDR